MGQAVCVTLGPAAWSTTERSLDLTPEEFYDGYANEAFVPAASEPMTRAFSLLEESEELLAWQGLSNFHWLAGCTELYAGFSTGLAGELIFVPILFLLEGVEGGIASGPVGWNEALAGIMMGPTRGGTAHDGSGVARLQGIVSVGQCAMR